jgi:hypothetical protein
MKKTWPALAASAVVATSLVVLAPAAQAAPQSCATAEIRTGYRGPGTVVYKSSSSTCNDLNLTASYENSAATSDLYAGFYRNSSGTWIRGSRGYIRAYDGQHSPWIVLLSDVNDGVPMSVGSYNTSNDIADVAH